MLLVNSITLCEKNKANKTPSLSLYTLEREATIRVSFEQQGEANYGMETPFGRARLILASLGLPELIGSSR